MGGGGAGEAGVRKVDLRRGEEVGEEEVALAAYGGVDAKSRRKERTPIDFFSSETFSPRSRRKELSLMTRLGNGD